MDFFERLDNIGRRVVPELRAEDHPTFECPKCLDSGLLHHQVRRRWKRSEANPEGAGEVSWFCRCATGERMECGYWFHVLYPTDEHGRRHLSTKGAARFKEYQVGESYHAGRIDQLVDGLRKRYEHERSRKLDAPDA